MKNLILILSLLVLAACGPVEEELTKEGSQVNDSFLTAYEIQEGWSVSRGGTRKVSQYYDFFKVVPSDSSLTITLRHKQQDAYGSSFRAYVYDANQTEIEMFSALNGKDNLVKIGTIPGAIYYVKVSVYDADPKFEYSLGIIGGNEYYEIEKNDDFASAFKLELSKEIRGHRNGSEYVDIFKVAPGKSDVLGDPVGLLIKLGHVIPDYDSNFTIYAYNAEGEQVDVFDASHGIGSERKIGVVPGETYYIKVYVGNAPQKYEYRLSVSAIYSSDTTYEIEPNNDFSDAHLIKPSGTIIGHRNGPEYTDCFRIMATGPSMKLMLGHGSKEYNSNYRAYVYNYSGTQLDVITALKGISAETTIGVVPGESYFIKVYLSDSPADLEYRLNVYFQ